MLSSLSVPQHVAIIMDGNGRWAVHRGRDRFYGHVRGSARVKSIVEECVRLQVKVLTLYAFSTENWKRPESERQILWKLLKKYLLRYTEELMHQNIRIGFIGQVDRLDPDLRALIQQCTDRLKKNTGLLLNFAISYGARSELVQAAKQFAEDCVRGEKKAADLSESVFQEYLDLETPVDLFIRTSGEFRVSNFLLWQSAYAEFVFTPVCWPDFSVQDLQAALAVYAQRERRFGGVETP